MNHYPKHVGDYIRDTVNLSMLEDGAYNRLLDQYYAREIPLPPTLADVYRMARAKSKPERAAVDYVLREFFCKESDGYHQKRADNEIGTYHSKSDKARESAHARWLRTNSDRNANASPEGVRSHDEGSCVGNASHKPLANTPLSPKNGDRGAASRGTRLPEDWKLPEEWRTWAQRERAEWPATHLELVALAFGDFWLAKAGQNARKVDWFATWRTWVRNERSAPKPANVAVVRMATGTTGARQGVANALWGSEDERERDITGEARRIA